MTATEWCPFCADPASSSLPTYEEVERLLDDIVSRIRPVIAGLQQRIDALYTGLTEVQQERDSYHREASKALEALATAERERDEARKTLKLHAGDTVSLSNELDDWRRRALEAEERAAEHYADIVKTREEQLAKAAGIEPFDEDDPEVAGRQWELSCEPEPRYFDTLDEALAAMRNLACPDCASRSILPTRTD